MVLRNKPAHEETEESLDGVVASSVRQEGLASSCDGPANHDGRYPHIGTELLADETAGKFCREEADEEDLPVSDWLALRNRIWANSTTNRLSVVEIIGIHAELAKLFGISI